MNGLHNLCCGLAQSFLCLLGRYLDGLRQTGYQVTSSDIHIIHFRSLIAGTDLDLQIFCGSLTDEQIVFLTHITNNSFVEIISGDLDGSADYRTSQRDHGDIGSTTADIHDHVTAGLGDINSGTDCCCNGLFNDGYLSGTCLIGSIFYGFLLYFRNAAGYADRDTGLTEGSLTQSLLDKILHHFLSYGIVGDNTLT